MSLKKILNQLTEEQMDQVVENNLEAGTGYTKKGSASVSASVSGGKGKAHGKGMNNKGGKGKGSMSASASVSGGKGKAHGKGMNNAGGKGLGREHNCGLALGKAKKW